MYLFPIDFIIDSKQTCKCHDIKNRNALGYLIESRCIDHANVGRLVVLEAPLLVDFISVLFELALVKLFRVYYTIKVVNVYA